MGAGAAAEPRPCWRCFLEQRVAAFSALPLAFHPLYWPSLFESPEINTPRGCVPETEGRLGRTGPQCEDSRAAPPRSIRGDAVVRGMPSADWSVGSVRCLPGRIWNMKTQGWKAEEAGVNGSTWLSEVFPAEASADSCLSNTVPGVEPHRCGRVRGCGWLSDTPGPTCRKMDGTVETGLAGPTGSSPF